jgi:hypothetical protein
MSGGHYTHNQTGWAKGLSKYFSPSQANDETGWLTHHSIFCRTDAINKIFSKDSVEDILAALVCANSQEFDSLCRSYALGFFFFFPPTICCHYFCHISIYCIWMKDFLGSNGCWHWLLQEAEFEESGEDWAKDLIKVFKRSSPMGLKVTLVSVIMIMRKSHHT